MNRRDAIKSLAGATAFAAIPSALLASPKEANPVNKTHTLGFGMAPMKEEGKPFFDDPDEYLNHLLRSIYEHAQREFVEIVDVHPWFSGKMEHLFYKKVVIVTDKELEEYGNVAPGRIDAMVREAISGLDWMKGRGFGWVGWRKFPQIERNRDYLRKQTEYILFHRASFV